jgi:hypothetical protein
MALSGAPAGRAGLFLACASLLAASLTCSDGGTPPAEADPDAVLFHLITVENPYTSYALFPGVDSITAGTLNGSAAHRPLVRVRLNAAAAGALVNGLLPEGGAFPDGAVIVKEILDSTRVLLLAVMRRDRGDPYAGEGWLWAEFEPDGTPFISVTASGRNCTGCHMREQGPLHDLVRTFERRR